MKTFLFVAAILASLTVTAQADPPKSGQSLGSITTLDGKTYLGATLAVIEPDGISILYADGGAKIPFASLSPDLQKQFGYDPEKSAFYAKEQQYLEQIAQLQRENAELRQKLNLASAVAPTTQSAVQSSSPRVGVEAFHLFFFELQSQSALVGGRVDQGYPKYKGGTLDGMRKGEAEVYAQQQWQSLSHDQQLAYEQKAQQFGDPIAKQEALDREEASHPSGATIYNSDGTVSQVQYH